MPNDIFPANLFNPMLLWTDLGLRAADMTLASSQNLGEGVDRLTRAGAGDEAADARSIGATATWVTPLGVDLPVRLHRTAFELMTYGWVQWMSTLGAAASFAAGLGARNGGRGDALDAFRAALLSGGSSRTVTQPAATAREHSGPRREAHTETGTLEHAHAAATVKRRRAGARSGAKARPGTARPGARGS